MLRFCILALHFVVSIEHVFSHVVLDEIKEATSNLQLDEHKKRDIASALHMHFKDWLYELRLGLCSFREYKAAVLPSGRIKLMGHFTFSVPLDSDYSLLYHTKQDE
ncbi:hypothetical protein HPP92_014972 [Vanilla planifolia]|uniref:Uncharacterized protein n=1 Tax=Vanilla planifolia TaxID=51239 RepID=A0A835UXE7_VANPL|nr:hypothetical protein HPP92_014972 [Vanilla planifolia]